MQNEEAEITSELKVLPFPQCRILVFSLHGHLQQHIVLLFVDCQCVASALKGQGAVEKKFAISAKKFNQILKNY